MNPRQGQSSTYAFLGTSDFGALVLKKLVEMGWKPELVITVPDKPSGRKQLPFPSQVKVAAQGLGLQVLEAGDSTDAAARLREASPDFLVLAAFGVLLSDEALAAVSARALNVHPSLLPKYRGPSPVQSAILAGEQTAGVSVILMDEEIDHGPVLAQEEVLVQGRTCEELKRVLALKGAELLANALPKWLEGSLAPVPQNHEEATFTKRFAREDGLLDWSRDAEYLERQVRAFTPWPGTYAFWKGKRLKILKASLFREVSKVSAGTLVRLSDGALGVQTGSCALRIDKLQLEGKNPMEGREFLFGRPGILGSRLN